MYCLACFGFGISQSLYYQHHVKIFISGLFHPMDLLFREPLKHNWSIGCTCGPFNFDIFMLFLSLITDKPEGRTKHKL